MVGLAATAERSRVAASSAGSSAGGRGRRGRRQVMAAPETAGQGTDEIEELSAEYGWSPETIGLGEG